MFNKKPTPIGEILQQLIRQQGLETPLLQKRVVDVWDTVVGKNVAAYSGEKFIKNQTLFVKISSPALRQNLSMMRSQLVKRLNDEVGSYVISDIRFF